MRTNVMMRRTGIVVTTIVFITFVGLRAARAAAAQAAATAPPSTDASDADRVSAGEIQRLYDAYALVQVQEALHIPDDQYGRVVPRLKALHEARRRHIVSRNRILQDLRRLTSATAAPVDEAAVRERLRALRDEDEKSGAELRKAYDAVDELLDVRQQARFRVFEEQMERKKLDLLMRARQNAKGRRAGA